MAEQTNYWTRRLISRRGALRGGGLGLAGLAGAALIGCSGDDDPTATPAPGGGGGGGGGGSTTTPVPTTAPSTPAPEAQVDLDAELTVGYGSFPPTLDTTTAGGSGGQAASNSQHFSQLFGYNAGRQIGQGGFADFEFREDNSIFRIALMPGVTFHNGEPLDAEHLKWHYDRILGRAEYNPDFQSAQAARASWMGEISIVDNLTLDIGMDPPFIDAAEQSGGINFAIVPRDYIVENGDEHFATNPIGIGPMKFESWVPDQEIIGTRFDNYAFGRDAPHQFKAASIGRLVGRFFPEEQARAAALEAGEIDIAYRIGSDVASQFASMDGFNVIVLPDTRVMSIELPLNSSVDPLTGDPNPWRDKRVRQAANYAIDTDSIIQNLLTGREERAYSPFPAGKPLPLGSLGAPYSYEPDRARALLEEAGQMGFAFKITLPTGLWTGDRTWMPAVQQMLNDVGFQVTVDYADFGNALAEIRNNEIPGPFIFNQGSTSDGAPLGPAFSYALITTVGAPYSHTQETDEFLTEFREFQSTVEQANAEFDTETRNDLYQQAAVLSYENAFAVPLFNLSHLYATTDKIVYNEYYDTSTGLNPMYAQKLAT